MGIPDSIEMMLSELLAEKRRCTRVRSEVPTNPIFQAPPPALDAHPTAPRTDMLLEKAVDALLARDFPVAWAALEAVLRVEPDNRLAAVNLARLRALGFSPGSR